MRPAFAGHPIAETLLLLSLAVWFVFEGRQALNRRTEATSSDRGSLMVLVLAGLGPSVGSWLSFAAMVLLPLGGFINRVRVEEAALSAALGSAYTDYARSRKRLIPFVW